MLDRAKDLRAKSEQLGIYAESTFGTKNEEKLTAFDRRDAQASPNGHEWSTVAHDVQHTKTVFSTCSQPWENRFQCLSNVHSHGKSRQPSQAGVPCQPNEHDRDFYISRLDYWPSHRRLLAVTQTTSRDLVAFTLPFYASTTTHIVRTPAGRWLVLRSVPMNMPTEAATSNRAKSFRSSGDGHID